MKTPEAAKELWCPMVRIARRESTLPNGDPSPRNIEIVSGCNTDALGSIRVPHSCRCIADQCAMWRWAYTTESVPADIEGASGAIVRTFEQRVTQTHGYCGLAPMQQVAS